ncbi:MAG: radical SAM/SPASM domain-containing protein [Candidatus Aenigmatarchaeota archaeon]
MKISTITSRLQRWSEGKIGRPVKVDIFPTQKCNLNCRFCEFPNVDPKEYKEELPTEKLLEIAGEAGKMGAEVFGIVGGEPFLKEGIIDIMKRVKESGMSGSVTTNGTLLDEESVQRIVDMKWDLLRISIDGVGSTHNKLRGKKGCFSRVTDTLELFKEKNSTYPTIEINTVFNRENYGEVSEVVELAHSYGIGRIILLPMIEFNERASDLKLREEDKQKVERSLKRAEDLAEEYNISINTEEVLEENFFSRSNETNTMIRDETVPCFMPWYSINVNPKGIATPCSQFDEEMGVDVRGMSLEDIWFSEKFEEIREMIANKNLPETCSKCCAPLLEENEEIRRSFDDEENLAKRYM